MKYLHIMQNEKFNKAYIEFIEENFVIEDHFFIFWGGISEDEINIPKKKYIYVIKHNFEILRLIKYMNNFKKIYLHGLFNRNIVILLYLQPWLLKKINWIVWGGDLYSYNEPKTSLIKKIYERVRRVVIQNVSEVSTLIEEDFVLAKKWYKVKGKYKKGFYMSPISTLESLDELIYTNKKNSKDICIQIGNSASKSNNHKEIINILGQYKEFDIKVYCPLSYGDEYYGREILEYGNKILGDKFIPITKFMEYNEYLEFLNEIDIAIFNNNRQQALGNIYRLLYLGKKVYIRNDTVMWNYFHKEIGAIVYDINEMIDLPIDKFIGFNKEYKLINKKNIRKLYTNEYALEIWKENFGIK